MKHRSKKILSYILTIFVLGMAGCWIAGKFLHLGNVEFTDNAQVNQQIVPINSRVRGYIKEIRFKDYQQVRKGDTLIVVEDDELSLNVARAKADLAAAFAGKDVANNSLTTASADAAVSESAIAEARVVMELAHADLERYGNLLERDAVTRQQYDVAKTDYEAKRARYDMLARSHQAAVTAVAVSRSNVTQSEAGIEQAETQLKMAELNLSYSVILAPCDGFTSRKSIQVGQFVQPGQTLLDLVAIDDVWVTANYKETQLRHITPGSNVKIKVDALPDVEFEGVVAAMSTATGASLSILPQDNSAGNFVKVRQRVPVRIDFTEDNSPEAMAKLRAGMNVECSVKY